MVNCALFRRCVTRFVVNSIIPASLAALTIALQKSTFKITITISKCGLLGKHIVKLQVTHIITDIWWTKEVELSFISVSEDRISKVLDLKWIFFNISDDRFPVHRQC